MGRASPPPPRPGVRWGLEHADHILRRENTRNVRHLFPKPSFSYVKGDERRRISRQGGRGGPCPILILPSSAAPSTRPPTHPTATSGTLLCAYQRSRFPPGRPPPPPNPPPPPPERCSIGFASFTVSVRPPMSEPLSAVIAAFASESEDISTKPNPRDCPVNLSAMIFAEATVPCAPNKSLNCCSVAE